MNNVINKLIRLTQFNKLWFNLIIYLITLIVSAFLSVFVFVKRYLEPEEQEVMFNICLKVFHTDILLTSGAVILVVLVGACGLFMSLWYRVFSGGRLREVIKLDADSICDEDAIKSTRKLYRTRFIVCQCGIYLWLSLMVFEILWFGFYSHVWTYRVGFLINCIGLGLLFLITCYYTAAGIILSRKPKYGRESEWI